MDIKVLEVVIWAVSFVLSLTVTLSYTVLFWGSLGVWGVAFAVPLGVISFWVSWVFGNALLH